jgi:hypothetical protein
MIMPQSSPAVIDKNYVLDIDVYRYVFAKKGKAGQAIVCLQMYYLEGGHHGEISDTFEYFD